MRRGKCTSVCRTGKFSTISRGEENQEAVHGSETRISHRELQGEGTGTAKPSTWKWPAWLEPSYLLYINFTVNISAMTVFVICFYGSPKWLLLGKLCMQVRYLLPKNIPKIPFWYLSIDVTQWCLTALTIVSL